MYCLEFASVDSRLHVEDSLVTVSLLIRMQNPRLANDCDLAIRLLSALLYYAGTVFRHLADVLDTVQLQFVMEG